MIEGSIPVSPRPNPLVIWPLQPGRTGLARRYGGNVSTVDTSYTDGGVGMSATNGAKETTVDF